MRFVGSGRGFKLIDLNSPHVDMDLMHEQQALEGPSHLRGKRVLALNADYQPLSYRPLSTLPWTKTMFLLVKSEQRVKNGLAPVIVPVDHYEGLVVRSGSREIPLPSVIAYTKMVRKSQRAVLNRFNLYLRDGYTCQYTGKQYPVNELTLDHVIPKSRGGGSTWENLVTCHRWVNHKKSDKTPKEAGLTLIRKPVAPSAWELHELGKNHPVPFDHHSWQDYVYWNVALKR